MTLVQRGFKFLSDEVAFVDRAKGTVVPFPRALGLRKNTLRMLSSVPLPSRMVPTRSLSGDDKWLVDMEDMRAGSIGQECTMDYIVFLNGFSDTTELLPMSSSSALINCMRFAHSSETDPMQSMLDAAGVMGKAKAYSLLAGPVEQAASRIQELVAS
jgi:hypothetical protein